jgi:hypothetical protein
MSVRLAIALVAFTIAIPHSARAAPGDYAVSRVDEGLAYINIGRKDGVAPGQAVEVVTREGADEVFHLGWIVLESCGETISLAHVPGELGARVRQGTVVRLPGSIPTRRVAAATPAPAPAPGVAPAAPMPPAPRVPEPSARFRHQGPALVPPGVPLTLSAYASAPLKNPVLMYRTEGDHGYTALPFTPQPDSYYTVSIPADIVQAPGLQYYIVVDDPEAQRQLAFANPQQPAEVAVEGRFNETHELSRYGVREELSTSTELVSYQTKGDAKDYYYRVEGEYLHRIFKQVYSMRFGAGYLAGSAIDTDMARKHVGFLYAHTEAEFRKSDFPVAFIPRLIFGVNDSGVGGGFEARVRLGDELGMNFEGGVTVLSQIGFETFTTLTLHPTQRASVALAAYLENLPIATNLGFRSYVDLRYRLGRASWGTARVGVAARSIETIGPDTGLGLALGF